MEEQQPMPPPDPPRGQTHPFEGNPPAPAKNVLRPLQRRAAVAWAGGLLSVGLLWGQREARVLHPHGLLLLLLLVVTFAAGIGALVRGLGRLGRGPRRG